MKKNNFDDSGVKVDYMEEVDENQLYDKKNQTDIIYVNSSASNIKNVLLIVLAVIFTLISLFTLIFGFVYFNKQVEVGETYTLFITHSDDSYGGNNITFGDYNSLENTYNYNFDVSNSNDIDLNYKIQIEHINFDSKTFDYSSINYSLLNYDSVVSEGVFNNNRTFDVVSMNIGANTKQQFVLKLWSNNIDKELEYSFKINILV